MALLTVKETSDVLGMPIKFVEDLMDKGKDGTKFKSKMIGKRKYIEIKPTALNYYKSQNSNKDAETLIQENIDLKNEIKNKEYQLGELISIVRQQTLALPKPRRSFWDYIRFNKKENARDQCLASWRNEWTHLLCGWILWIRRCHIRCVPSSPNSCIL